MGAVSHGLQAVWNGRRTIDAVDPVDEGCHVILVQQFYLRVCVKGVQVRLITP